MAVAADSHRNSLITGCVCLRPQVPLANLRLFFCENKIAQAKWFVKREKPEKTVPQVFACGTVVGVKLRPCRRSRGRSPACGEPVP